MHESQIGFVCFPLNTGAQSQHALVHNLPVWVALDSLAAQVIEGIESLALAASLAVGWSSGDALSSQEGCLVVGWESLTLQVLWAAWLSVAGWIQKCLNSLVLAASLAVWSSRAALGSNWHGDHSGLLELARSSNSDDGQENSQNNRYLSGHHTVR